MTAYMATVASARRRPAAFTLFLWFVMALFIGILVYVWVESKRANPILLDEHGHPVGQHSPADTHKAH